MQFIRNIYSVNHVSTFIELDLAYFESHTMSSKCSKHIWRIETNNTIQEMTLISIDNQQLWNTNRQ